ncbi:MAG: hypothetical protein ACP5IZ_07345 [Thermoprotei archaeon]|jgi:hypothetical protein
MVAFHFVLENLVFVFIFLVLFLPIDLSFYPLFFWFFSLVFDLISTRKIINVERNLLFMMIYKRVQSFKRTAVLHVFLIEIPILLIITLILQPLTLAPLGKASLILTIAHTDATIKNITFKELIN